MKIKRINLLKGLYLAALFSSFIYLIVDIPHYMIVRLNPDFPHGIITEAFYESTEISLLRWLILISVIFVILVKLDKVAKSIVFFASGVYTWLLFFIKGRGISLIIGSPVYNCGMMEIISILCLILGVLTFQVSSFKGKGVIIITVIICSAILFFLINLLPPVNKIDS